jgi:hypothetical protein
MQSIAELRLQFDVAAILMVQTAKPFGRLSDEHRKWQQIASPPFLCLNISPFLSCEGTYLEPERAVFQSSKAGIFGSCRSRFRATVDWLPEIEKTRD